jgi:integrase
MLCEWAYRFSSATLACERPWKSRERSSDPGPYADPPVAAARRHKSAPTLSEIETVLSAMPASTDLERRDRAIVAFTILTGARDRAIVPFKLKHVDLKRRMLNQDAREVHTKRAKTFVSWFFPVGDHIERIVTDWIGFLGNEKCFGLDDPLFPKTKVEARMEAGFQASGLAREHWANASPIRAIFKGAFSRAGLPYRNPHSFRNTLVQVAYDRNLGPEAFKACSQNLGHENCLTTFSSYGTIPASRQAELLLSLANSSAVGSRFGSDTLRAIADQMERQRP